jgi:6-phosphogluconolactonase/glucosamine-6-phosphate isomerase/deaminase
MNIEGLTLPEIGKMMKRYVNGQVIFQESYLLNFDEIQGMLPDFHSNSNYFMCSSGFFEDETDKGNDCTSVLILVADEAQTRALFLCLLETEKGIDKPKVTIIKDFTEEEGI